MTDAGELKLPSRTTPAEKLKILEAAYKKYYDDATDDELREEAAWGTLGLEALAEVEWQA